jgi:predicted phage-related endonuclease
MVLAQAYPTDEVPFDNSLDELMNEYATMKVLQEEAAALVESKKQEIKTALGDRILVDCKGFRLHYKPIESTRFKSSALKKENPDLYEKYAYKSVSRPLRIRSI